MALYDLLKLCRNGKERSRAEPF